MARGACSRTGQPVRIPAVTARAKDLFDASVDAVGRGDIRGALGTLLDALALDPVHGPSLDAAARICRILGSPGEADLFAGVTEHPAEVDAWLLLAHHLVEQGRPDVATALLGHALSLDPEHLAVRREMAFACLLARDFAGCGRLITSLLDEPALAESERVDLLLMSAEASLYAGQRGPARRQLAEADDLLTDDDQRARLDALHALLGRSTHFPDLATADLRAWHFIQHAGVLLKTAGGYFEDGSLGGRFDHLALRPDMLAFLLRRAADVLAECGADVEVVIPASELAEPLARALATLLGAGFVPDLTERKGRTALLLASSAAEYAPFVAGLARHRPELRLFAIWMDWSRDHPVSPEIVGTLARRVLLPWETRYAIDANDPSRMQPRPGDDRPAAAIAADLVDAAAALPDDGGAAREEFLGFYRPLRDELVLANETRHPHRRRFTHLSPK